MISVTKDFSKIPAKLLTQQCQALIQLAITEKSKHDYKKDYYGSCKGELEADIYNYKCCFCESNSSASNYGRVDHFRPKKESPKKTKYGKHNGYYWLGYEWSNLLLICEKCNTRKSSHFPLFDDNNRINNHSLDQNQNLISLITDELYQNEGNVLLNPEVDKVEDFFIFKPDGDIVGIDQNRRGETSIELYDLRRDQLILARKKISDDYFDEIKAILADYWNGIILEQSVIDSLNIKFSILSKKLNSDREYSRVWFFLFHKFHVFAKYYLQTQRDYDFITIRFNMFLGK